MNCKTKRLQLRESKGKAIPKKVNAICIKKIKDYLHPGEEIKGHAGKLEVAERLAI